MEQVQNVEQVKKMTTEEIDSLAMVLMPEILAFYKSERGKSFWNSYQESKSDSQSFTSSSH